MPKKRQSFESSNAESRTHLELPDAPKQAKKPVRVRKTLSKQRVLQPGQAGIAWERLKRVVREHCRHPGHNRFAFQIYGPTIEFQSAADGLEVMLIRKDDKIVKCVAGKKESIRIVRLKTKGVGFDFRKHYYSATRLLIEIVNEALEAAAPK